ncbi:MAG: FAD-binding oxidoreductase [Gaiellales bacterium]
MSLSRQALLAQGARLAAGGAVASLGFPALAGAKTSPVAELRKAIGQARVVVPGDPRYASVRLPWNRRYDTVKPLAVALPASPEHVAACVKWAQKHGIRLAIRGGGHSFAGHSSSTGLVIDLRKLSAVTPSGNKARIGAGARLGDVYARLWSAGQRAIPAGTAPTVGIAGLTLGGGHGFLTRKLGLACDALLAATVVTADGKVRTCSETNEKELFWALRGAGWGNFGVVTSFIFETTEIGPVTTVNLEWAWSRGGAADLIEAWTAFMASAPDELSTVLALRLPKTGGDPPKLALNGLYAGPKAAALAALQPFVTATTPTKVNVVARSFSGAVSYFAGAQSEKRRFIGAASAYANTPLSASGRDAVVDLVLSATDEPGVAGGGVILFALGGAVGRVSKGATAFVHRSALFSVEVAALWDTPGETEPVRAWFDTARAVLTPYVSSEAVQNYADPDLAYPQTAYYASNLARLGKLKKAIDPKNVFRHAQSVR